MPEYYANLPGIFHALVKGADAVYVHAAGGGLQNAGKHFDGGGFSCAIFPNKANDFPIAYGKADIVNSPLDGVFAGEQIPHSREFPLFLHGYLKLLFQVAYFNQDYPSLDFPQNKKLF